MAHGQAALPWGREADSVSGSGSRGPTPGRPGPGAAAAAAVAGGTGGRPRQPHWQAPMAVTRDSEWPAASSRRVTVPAGSGPH